MSNESLPPSVIQTFEKHYKAVCGGATGLIPESTITPASDVASVGSLQRYRQSGVEALSRSVVIKLNGGLGTGMGMAGAKSLLRVKDDLTFLDIIAKQVLRLRQSRDCKLPLLLMSSYRTQQDSIRVLDKYPELRIDGLALDFLQHKVPRIDVQTLEPAHWPRAPSQEWCPPGHGDIYAALQTSGVLAALLAKGYEYAFVSNGDNLGATVELNILGWMAQTRVPFVMEVARRTASDRKGGHLATSEDGRLLLRESAQCAPEDVESFQDIQRHRFFNTNNLWLNLRALDAKLQTHRGVLPLPLMVNKKQMDGAIADSPWVYQTETAMGAAIGLFDGARAVLVGRERFAPVKSTSDLLKLWSDLYVLSEDFVVEPISAEASNVVIELDEAFYKHMDSFRLRFPKGAPKLLDAQRLTVSGDVRFGANVVIKGAVSICNDEQVPMKIADNSVLESR